MTEKVSGDNVRIARVFRGKSQDELAELVSASSATIWNVEKGIRAPSETLLEAIALVLGFDQEFFLNPLPTEFTVGDCSFRSSVSATERTRKQLLARGTLFAQLVHFLHTKATFPAYKVPCIPVQSDEDIEIAAQQCREAFGLGKTAPVGSMALALEHHGVMVATLDGESTKLDAFSAHPKGAGVGFVVLSDAKGSASRARFDMAHELGHLVMHPDLIGDLDEREKQADKFASAFLMPKDGFAREFWAGGKVDWTRIFQLKAHWRVSIQAMISRAYALKLIDAVEYRRAYKLMSARGWRKAEPHEFTPEVPTLFAKTMHALVAKKGMTKADIAKQVRWSEQTLTDVTRWVEPPPEQVATNTPPPRLSLVRGSKVANR